MDGRPANRLTSWLTKYPILATTLFLHKNLYSPSGLTRSSGRPSFMFKVNYCMNYCMVNGMGHSGVNLKGCWST